MNNKANSDDHPMIWFYGHIEEKLDTTRMLNGISMMIKVNNAWANTGYRCAIDDNGIIAPNYSPYTVYDDTTGTCTKYKPYKRDV